MENGKIATAVIRNGEMIAENCTEISIPLKSILIQMAYLYGKCSGVTAKHIGISVQQQLAVIQMAQLEWNNFGSMEIFTESWGQPVLCIIAMGQLAKSLLIFMEKD
jgi:hypothetical protein